MGRFIVWLFAAIVWPVSVFAEMPIQSAPATAAPPVQSPTSNTPPGLQAPIRIGPPPACHQSRAAIGLRDAGETVIEVKVGKTGTVEDGTIVQTSGSRELDSAAQLCAKTWLYKPATRDGQPIESLVKMKVDWQPLHREEATPALPDDAQSPNSK
jgi:TonB family protein